MYISVFVLYFSVFYAIILFKKKQVGRVNENEKSEFFGSG